jgi:DNA-binding beta-propeller fold protein YncE
MIRTHFYQFFFIAFLTTFASCAKEQEKPASGPQVKTIAGKSIATFLDGKGGQAGFNYPIGIAIDPSGNIFIADQHNNAIRKMDPLGNVTTFAGAQKEGLIDGMGTAARFYHPTVMISDPSGNLFVTDYENNVVRKVTNSGLVTTYAGLGPYSGGFLNSPDGIAIDQFGNLFVSNYNRHEIKKIDASGNVMNFAGSGMGLHQDGVGMSASFVSPCGLAMDMSGNLFVADAEGHRIRKIAPDATVTTLAGTGQPGYIDGEGSVAQFKFPQQIAIDAQGNLLVTDYGNNRIRKITPEGIVSTLAGNGVQRLIDGPVMEAAFALPNGIAVAKDGRIYVSESGSNQIRVIIP